MNELCAALTVGESAESHPAVALSPLEALPALRRSVRDVKHLQDLVWTAKPTFGRTAGTIG
jgi:hypothetical protein